MYTRIVFISDYHVTRRDFERFQAPVLLKNGFTVEFWDCTALFTEQEIPLTTDALEFSGLHVLPDKKTLLQSVRGLDKTTTMIFLLFPCYLKRWWIYRLISEHNVPYGVFSLCTIPATARPSDRDTPNMDGTHTYKNSETAISLLIKKILTTSPKKLLSRLDYMFKHAVLEQLPFWMLGIAPAAFWFISGEMALHTYRYPLGKNTRIVHAHALDYELYLQKEAEGIAATPEKRIVFLDEYGPFHQDAFLMGITPYITAERYYPSLCRFFGHIEKELHTTVEIAAHPSSAYEEHPDYFQGRPWLRGHTVEMVKNSRGVIAFHSTSIHFAVIYKRPIIFIVTDEYARSPDYSVMKEIASWFGKAPINIDGPLDNIDWKKELTVDEKLYDEYRDLFLKKNGSPEKPFGLIMLEEIKAFGTTNQG